MIHLRRINIIGQFVAVVQHFDSFNDTVMELLRGRLNSVLCLVSTDKYHVCLEMKEWRVASIPDFLIIKHVGQTSVRGPEAGILAGMRDVARYR